MTKEDYMALYQIVDRTNMRAVLNALSQIASEKQQFLSRSMPDQDRARAWRKAELQLDRLACNMSL